MPNENDPKKPPPAEEPPGTEKKPAEEPKEETPEPAEDPKRPEMPGDDPRIIDRFPPPKLA